jgi:hypothetical protein
MGNSTELVFSAHGLGIDPKNPVYIKTITGIGGNPDKLRHNVVYSNSKPFFDEYTYGPLGIIVDPRDGSVVAVSAPAEWWQAGLKNVAGAELRRSISANGTTP